MVKIRVSYHTEEELEKVLELLKPMVKEARIRHQQQGNFKKVYIDVRIC